MESQRASEPLLQPSCRPSTIIMYTHKNDPCITMLVAGSSGSRSVRSRRAASACIWSSQDKDAVVGACGSNSVSWMENILWNSHCCGPQSRFAPALRACATRSKNIFGRQMSGCPAWIDITERVCRIAFCNNVRQFYSVGLRFGGAGSARTSWELHVHTLPQRLADSVLCLMCAEILPACPKIAWVFSHLGSLFVLQLELLTCCSH